MIVTMATSEYIKDLRIMLDSLDVTTGCPCSAYLINVDDDIFEKLRTDYPHHIFYEHKKEYPKKRDKNAIQKRRLVTFLKGEFMYDCMLKNDGPLIWIDATSLINKDLSILYDIIQRNDALLIRRDKNRSYGKAIYLAGLFAFNGGTLPVLEKFRDECNKKKTEWFADQLALCCVPSLCKVEYLNQKTFLSLHYLKNSYIWADRGIRGVGQNTVEDYIYTEKKFINRLEEIRRDKQ